MRLLPSADRLPRTMPRSVRFVTLIGAPPSIDCFQTLARSTVENRIDRPSGAQSISPLAVAGAMGPSTRAAARPSIGITTIESGPPAGGALMPASIRPPGEFAGRRRGADHRPTIRGDRQPGGTRQVREQSRLASVDVHAPDARLPVAVRDERDRSAIG